jgi:GEVED domain
MTRRGLSILCLCLAATVPAFGQYCSSTTTGNACGIDEYIANVTCGGLNNNSACVGPPSYEDFTGLVGPVCPKGAATPITVTIGTYWGGDEVDVWCDWNGNLSFNDPGEHTALFTAGGVATGNISAPLCSVGSTRMRVILRYFGTANPCATTTFGNTEDYTVTAPDPYCTLSTTLNACGIDEYIANVSCGGMNNASACSGPPSYEDFSCITGPNCPVGFATPITVTIGTFWGGDEVDVYCDWNGNGLLTDAGEHYPLVTAAGTSTGAITPPLGALSGVKMRVVLRYFGVAQACGTANYGNTEDYTVTTVGLPACILSFSSPFGPGSLQMDNTPCAPAAGASYLNAITLAQGTTPAGWFFGLDITLAEVVNQLNLGYPFSGTLDAFGASTFLLPAGAPSGLQIWAVSANFTPGFGSFILARPLVTYVLP